MSFRIGAAGTEMWPQCRALGLAAISYKPLCEVDLSTHERGEPAEKWAQLKTAQKASLEAFAFEMQPGDIIYVKQGPSIISRGLIEGPYQFEAALNLRDEKDMPWPHQLPVVWEPYFLAAKVQLGAEMSTVKKLSEEEIERLEKIFRVFDHAKYRKKVEIRAEELAELAQIEAMAEDAEMLQNSAMKSAERVKV